jgi:hypothetical protein
MHGRIFGKIPAGRSRPSWSSLSSASSISTLTIIFASVAAITIGENLGHPCASPFYLASKIL